MNWIVRTRGSACGLRQFDSAENVDPAAYAKGEEGPEYATSDCEHYRSGRLHWQGHRSAHTVVSESGQRDRRAATERTAHLQFKAWGKSRDSAGQAARLWRQRAPDKSGQFKSEITAFLAAVSIILLFASAPVASCASATPSFATPFADMSRSKSPAILTGLSTNAEAKISQQCTSLKALHHDQRDSLQWSEPWWNSNHVVLERFSSDSSGGAPGESPGSESSSGCVRTGATFSSLASSLSTDVAGHALDWSACEGSGEDVEGSDSAGTLNWLAVSPAAHSNVVAATHGPLLAMPGGLVAPIKLARRRKDKLAGDTTAMLGVRQVRRRRRKGEMLEIVAAVDKMVGKDTNAGEVLGHLSSMGARGAGRGARRSRGRSVRHCAHAEGCEKYASFGDPAQPRGDLFCKQHKDAAHRNVVSKRCHCPGCEKRPIFGDPHTHELEFCRQHKLDFHVDLQVCPTS